MKRQSIFKIVLTLMMLWLTLSPGLVAGQPSGGQPSSTEQIIRMVTVPESLLRRATARIDSLDLELRLAQNKAVERDSVSASTIRFHKGMAAQAWQQAEAWERRANSWWHQNKSAFWVALGAFLAALGLR